MDAQNVQPLVNVVADQPVLRVSVRRILLISVALLMSFVFSNPEPYNIIAFFFHVPSRFFLLLFNDKNYVFLLCNGIIVVLAKSYRVFSSMDQSLKPDDDDHIQDYHGEENSALPPQPIFSSTAKAEPTTPVQPLLRTREEERAILFHMNENVAESEEEVEKLVIVEGNVPKDMEEEEEMEVKYACSSDEESLNGQEEDNSFDDEEGAAESKEYCWVSEEEEQTEEELHIANMSTEELNRKFDEFIRRMKEEIRIEARSQLVMV